jgi:hypothetical protein
MVDIDGASGFEMTHFMFSNSCTSHGHDIITILDDVHLPSRIIILSIHSCLIN